MNEDEWDEGAEEALVPIGQVVESIQAAAWDRALAQARADVMDLGSSGMSKRHERPMFTPALSLWDDVDEEVRDLVESLVPERALTVQSSDPKTGKTWLEEEMAVAIATATPAFGEFPTGPEPRPVALILCEDSRKATKTRLRAIAASRGMAHVDALKRIYLVCRPHFDLLSIDDLAWIVASARTLPEPPALLIIDPLRDAHSGKEVEDMDRVTRVLRQLITLLDCAVFITHHNRKPPGSTKDAPARGGSPGDEMRGGGELRGRIDSGIYPRRKGGDGQTTFDLEVRTETRDGRSAGAFDLRLAIEDDEHRRAKMVRWTVVRGGGQQGDEERVVEALRALNGEHSGDYHEAKAVAKRAGLKEMQVRDVLSALVLGKRAERGVRINSWRIVQARQVAA